jgi:nucleoside-diphosphate-sugar epimerase
VSAFSRRTLVTGGAGFVGSYVVRALLDAGREVLVLDVKDFAAEGRFVLGERARDVAFEQASVADRALLFDHAERFRPEEIVHMAMMLDPAHLAVARDGGLDVNVGGTVNVLEATRAFGVRRLVNFSSIGVLPKVQYEPIDARHPLVLAGSGPGTGFYGAHKVAGEVLCFAYHRALGLDFRTIRPSAVYGLGMNRFPGPIKDLVEGAVRGEQVRFEYGGRHPRDYTHASDIAGLVLAVLEGPDDADRIFYGATGEPLVTTTEVAQLVNELVPGADVGIGEELSEAELPVMELRGQLSVDNAREQLGWVARYRSIRDGIARYADDYHSFLEAS